MEKIIIIGLPRTGTTSASIALLEAGLKVAHIGLTRACFDASDAISDAPCFSEYKQLHEIYPQARFVYLNRPLSSWLPSITMLLTKMVPRLNTEGKFHPVLKRSFENIFSFNSVGDVFSEDHLRACYQRHQQEVYQYFSASKAFITIDVSQAGSLTELLKFLNLPCKEGQSFSHYNMGRAVAGWGEYKHPNKVSCNLSGEHMRKFFDYRCP